MIARNIHFRVYDRLIQERVVHVSIDNKPTNNLFCMTISYIFKTLESIITELISTFRWHAINSFILSVWQPQVKEKYWKNQKLEMFHAMITKLGVYSIKTLR